MDSTNISQSPHNIINQLLQLLLTILLTNVFDWIPFHWYGSETLHHHGDLEECRHDNNQTNGCYEPAEGENLCDFVSHTHPVTKETGGCGLTSAALGGDFDARALSDGKSCEGLGARGVDPDREVKVLFGGCKFHGNSVALGDLSRIGTEHLETYDPLLRGGGGGGGPRVSAMLHAIIILV